MKIVRLLFPIGATAAIVFSASAYRSPERARLQNYDKRDTGGSAGSIGSSQQAAAAQLKSVTTAQVHFDPVIGSAAHVAVREGFLTGADINLVKADPYGPTKKFLEAHRDLFGHGSEVLRAAVTSRDFTGAHNGMRTVVWQQQVDQIPVFEAVLVSHTTSRGELVSISSRFLADPANAAIRGTPNKTALIATPIIRAKEAIALAASNVGEAADATQVTLIGNPSGHDKKQKHRAPFAKGDIGTALTWLAMDRDNLRLCWDVLLTSRTRDEMFRVLVDAQTGEVLVRRNLTDYLSNASYRVYTSDSPSPFSPGWPTPTNLQPPLVARTLVTLSALDTNASPAGWIDDGGNETRGNNVDAHTDLNSDNAPDLPRPQGSPFRVFDFAMNLSNAPANYTNAAVVQLFYLCNWMHDRLYQLGFTEAAGNFQSNNFGRGGVGNDAVQADAQDGGGFNNANFSTPPDGNPGRMQMYVFNGPSPARDGDFDAEVVLHEYTHGLSNRRVGGGVGISALQPSGMGEGWSDWYGLSLLSEAGDDVNGNYAAGGYASYLFSGLSQNYYFGIRRYPYTTDMTKNPLTFKDIDPAQASSHAGIPRSPVIGTTANEVHNMGEVWCVTLWDMRANLVTKYGWAIGNQLALQLVTDGMNLSPANPNFLQARDAIIQADLVDNGGANRAQLWAAFAKRGMGVSATSPSSSTTTGIHEAFDLPDDLSLSPQSLTSSGAPGGPFTPGSASFVLTNTGSNALSWTLMSTSVWLNISPVSGTLSAGAGATVSVSPNGAANTFGAGIYTASIWFTNLTSGIAQARQFKLAVVGQNMFDDFDPDIDLTQWSDFGGVLGTTVVGTNYGGKVSGANSLWFGDDGSRYATSLPLDTHNGGIISFYLHLANGPAWPWENVDIPGEGIVLEYSTNSGSTWGTAGTYNTSTYYNWTFVTLPIPAAAQSPSTLFRWRQLSHSGSSFDHWALDDVFINASPLAPVIATQPQSVAAVVGDRVTFNVTAYGSAPLSYQWFSNGTNIPGATTTSFTLAAVKLSDAGGYSVLVTNPVGSSMSSTAALSVVAVPPCVSPPAGIAGWWKAEGDSTDSIGTNPGYVSNGVTFAIGEVGQCFQFDGISGQVVMPASAALNAGLSNGLTLECWIQPNDLNTPQPLVDWGTPSAVGTHFWIAEPWFSGQGGPGDLFANIVDTAGSDHILVSAAGVLDSTRLQHVAVTYDKNSGIGVIYLNGAVVATANLGTFTPQTTYDLSLGRRPNHNPAGVFNGLMDELALYARALSASEIQAIYMARASGKCSAPVAPRVISQPTNVTVTMGDSAAFRVVANGTSPLTYQWRKDSTNLPGATASTLLLANVQLVQAGIYSVAIFNSAGGVESSNAVLTVNPIPPCAGPSSGIVSWWRAEGNALDQTGGNNGTMSGNADFTASKVSAGFVFDGSGDAVMIGNPTNLQLQNFTIEAWIKRFSTTASSLVTPDAELFCYGAGGYGFGMWNDGRLFLTQAAVNNVATSTGITDTNFHHVAITKTNTAVIFYIDGVPQTIPAYSSVFTFTTPAAIGARGDDLNNSFYGIIDELAVYSRALSTPEIQGIYNAGSSGKCATPVPPTILTQPANQSVYVGSTASFNPVVAGTPPLFYEWLHDSNNVPNGTNVSLVISNAQLSDAGNYWLFVSNSAGAATSSTAVLTVNVNPSNCVPAPSGIVSWWRAEGTASDSISANNGTPRGNLSFGAGESGQGFVFDGNTDAISLGNPTNLQLQDFSIETWVKRSSLTASSLVSPDAEIFCNGANGYGFGMWSDGTLFLTKVGIDSISTAAPFAVTNLNFHHIAVTKSGSTVTFYIDGNSQVVPGYTSVFSFGNGVTIGARADNLNNSFYGTVDELAVYSRALTAFEIQSIYLGGSQGKCGPLISPIITQQPTNQTVNTGEGALFNVNAGGTQPLLYQWRLAGTNILGATTNPLILNNVTFAHAGSYSVAITNAAGAILSSNALLTVNPAPGCVAPAPNIVSWWKGEGNAADTIGGISGFLSNGVVFNSGEVGQCFNFDGINGQVVIPAAPVLNVGTSNGFTVECWIKPRDTNTAEPVIEWGNASAAGVHLWINEPWFDGQGGPGDIFANVVDTAGNDHVFFTGPGLLDPSRFQHVALTYNKTNATAIIYLNGTAVTSASLGLLTPQTTYALNLGHRPDNNPAGYYGGLMDEVSVYGRALAASEILAIYNAASSGKCTNSGTIPVITTQPQSQTVATGSNATFSVVATGTAPLFYQWSKGSNAIAGATNSAYSIASVQTNDAGAYSVIVSNALAAVRSSNAVLAVVTLSNQCTTAPSGLASWWRGESNAADHLGLNNGIAYGPIAFTNGVVGQAFTFDGNSAHVRVPDSASLHFTNAFTLEAWVRPTSHGNYHEIFNKWDIAGSGHKSYVLQLLPDGTPELTACADGNDGFDTDVPGTNSLPVNQWTHLAGTYDGSALRLYVNGVLQASAAYPYGVFPGTGDLGIGGTVGTGTPGQVAYVFAGQIDEPSVYARALGLSEIQMIYNAGAAGKCPIPVMPSIIRQPASQTNVAGWTANFAVTAAGTGPLLYQWRFKGTNIPSATSSVLILQNVQTAQAGAYAILVTNVAGSVLSSNAILTVIPPVACTQAPSGLVSWWRGEFNAFDNYGANNGTLYGPAGFTNGVVGQCFNFDGSSAHVHIHDSASLHFTNAFTLEAWVRPTAHGDYHEIFNKWDLYGTGQKSYVLQLLPDGRPELTTCADGNDGFDTDAPGTNSLPLNVWTHLAGTYDGSALRLYVNGALQTVVAYPYGVFPGTDDLGIGGSVGGAAPGQVGNVFAGQIDEPSVYNRALTASEVLAIYNAGTGGKCLPNHPPVVGNMNAATKRNRQMIIDSAKFLALASDPDGDPLTLAGVSSSSTNGGVVSVNSNQVFYTPRTNYIGADRFTFSIADNHGGTNSGFVFIQVRDTNQVSGNMLPVVPVPGGYQVNFLGIPGLTYTLQRATNLAGPWLTLSIVLADQSGVGTFADTNAPPANAFYRTTYP